mmetsp:Transcript_102232/g.329631  ORF Transcript_102232/g.329631 Transcript_102232/m.329631 type:complete len:372 (-) Transcript_102232:84-1199(-)
MGLLLSLFSRQPALQPVSKDIRSDAWSRPDTIVDTTGIPGGGRRVFLVSRPQGDFKDSDFRVVDEPIPEPADGQVVVQNILISIDPTHRIWASDRPQYMPSVGLNTVMRAGTVAKVIKSSDESKMPVGTLVSGSGGVQEYAMLPMSSLNRVIADVPLSWNHSVLSVVIGLTAWVGTNICEPKAGETMVVSGAAGAVGSVAAQLAKARGARVIGIAGGAEKCAWLTGIGLDGVIDYKADDISSKLDELCPDGVHSYFDNVAGPTLEILLTKMRNFGRIAFCGAISSYNSADQKAPVTNFAMVLMRRLTVQGFVCVDYIAQLGDALAELTPLVKGGGIKVREDIQEVKVDAYPSIVRMLYDGQNKGKLMMKIA